MQIAKTLLFKSTLSTIASVLDEARNAEEARSSIMDHLSGSSPRGKRKVIEDIERLETLEEIHRCTEEALSKYGKLNGKLEAV